MNQQDIQNPVRSEGLGFLWIELTNQCNLACSHCYAESGPDKPREGAMTCRDHEKVLSDAYAVGCRKVQFIGGEPTLNRDLPELIGHASEIGYEFIEVFTNLTRISDELRACFEIYGVHVATSVYAPDPTTHDRITGVPGSFEKTVRNIRQLLSQGTPVRAGFIEMDANAGLYDETKRFLGGIGIEHVGMDHMRGFGRGSKCEKGELGELCGACGQDTLCVGPDGEVSPCIMSKAWPAGSVLDAAIPEIVSSDTLARIRGDIRLATAHKKEGPSACDPQTCNPYASCSPQFGPGPCTPSGCFPCLPNGISARA